MIPKFRNIRAKYAATTKAITFGNEFTEMIYQTYLNHHKIIHFRNGLPVYSLSTPALYSKPAANFFSRLIFRVIQNRSIPGLMSYAVNDECNANCEHCSFFTSVDDKKKTQLTLEESKKLMKDAQELGVTIINIVGGEPLMRADLCEIIDSVDKDLSEVILFTNGWYLEEKVDDLKKAGLNGLYVSIDAADEASHDKIRRTKGLYAKAMRGIDAALAKGFTVGISCCLDEDGYKKGELDKIIELAKSKGIHEVLVFDKLPVGRQKNNKSLLQHKEWVEDMINHVGKYNEDLSYPGVIIYAYSTSHRSVGCSGGTSYFYVTPYGEICPCDFYHTKFGSVREEPLYKIVDRMSQTEGFVKSKWGGCRVKDEECLLVEKNSKKCENCN
jgi:MoaA/NifB/PqqE/SkfB family radical SAM enzyme